MKNFFLQKISLLLMVLLTLSGCALEFRKGWAFQYSPESKTFLYDGNTYEYSYIDGSVKLAGESDVFASESEDGDTYYWSKIDGNHVYFKVDSEHNIYGFTGSNTNKVYNTNTGTINIYGDVSCTGAGGIAINNANTGTINIYGDVSYTGVGGIAIYNANTGTVNIYGDVYVSESITSAGAYNYEGDIYIYGTTESYYNGTIIVYDDTDPIKNNLATIASGISSFTKID